MKTLQNKPKEESDTGLTSRMSADRARPRLQQNTLKTHIGAMAPVVVLGTQAQAQWYTPDTIFSRPSGYQGHKPSTEPDGRLEVAGSLDRVEGEPR